MKRVLITGVSGFVGHHFLQYLHDIKVECSILGIDMNVPQYDTNQYLDSMQIEFRRINLLNIDDMAQAIGEFMPDYILHLASFSSVAYSWQHPTESFANNTNIFLNLVTVVAEKCRDCRVLSVGSSEEYGNVQKEDIPIKERLRLRPVSPYAVARVSQEMLSQLYVESYGLNIVMTRSFNHIGPWQDDRFAIPRFIKQAMEIKREGMEQGIIEAGNVEVVRDFVDVRDVVRAYWLLLEHGTEGEVYNICSGYGYKLRQIIQIIAEQLGITIDVKIDSKYVRPNDNKLIIGENYKIYDAVGWKPLIDIKESIRDIILNVED